MKKYQIFLLTAFVTNHMPVNANTSIQTTLQVQATVLASCSIVTQPTLLNFQNYTGVLANSQSSLQVICTNGTAYHVLMGPGNSGSVNARTMASGTNTLPYGIYRDSSYTNNWGQTPGTDDVVQSGSGLPQTIPIYGKISAGQTPQPGVYNDTIPVTIQY